MEHNTEFHPLQAQQIQRSSQETVEQGHFCAGMCLSAARLIYVLEGTLFCSCDGIIEQLQPGEMIVFAPNQWHMGYTELGTAPRLLLLDFAATGTAPAVGRKHSAPFVGTLLRQIIAEQEEGIAFADSMGILLLNQLLLLWQRETGTPQAISGENTIICRAQRIICDHVRQRLSVPSVAQRARVSPSYLTGLFQKHLQLSPGEYIRRAKLQESKKMIREGELNFTQIASALEYSTVHHFSRQFKEKFGVTPTQYAKTVR
ncbi:MAG: helix-turn-helix transcriptional regulator [Oscillospiraceae bacterium]|nr:helix-turn-helix transcriptional regulator [Oscillospiraceae bacterium]